jgi:hypothetical protein
VLLSVCDPACAWGTLLPVPLAEGLSEGGAIPRIASNFVVVEDGKPCLVLEQGARRLRVTGSREPEVLGRAAQALETLGGVIELEEVDGVAIVETPIGELLRGAGFERDGARLRRGPLGARPVC